jgi:3-mercaptopyruvate sulfurtransferase SseA
MRLGFRNVSEFKGGMEMWQQAGHPVTETTTGPPARPDTAPAR